MEDRIRKLPIGVQNFESLRRDGYLYVDKTKYIYSLAHSGRQFFLSRPRRFGKSLLLSTLRAYWEGKRELFDGLEISALEKENGGAWQAYPVFYFDFNGKNYESETALEEVLDQHLREWESVYGGDSWLPLEERFQKLLMTASRKCGRRCVVLVDEYDKPLLEVQDSPEQEEHNKAVFKGFFGMLKTCDEYLKFAFITGVTKFSKISIFSDLNQLNDISLSYEYACICGMTEEELRGTFQPEVSALSRTMGKSEEECLSALRTMYDGYRFHPKAEGLYNPFSLLKALFDRELNAYWFATGTPTFLTWRIRNSGFDVRKFTDRTLYTDAASLSDYRSDNPDLLPILYQTGYLTLCGYDERRQRYTLGFPNEEVKYGFLQSLVPAYAPAFAGNSGLDLYTLDDCVENGSTDGIRDILSALFASIPYTTADRPFEHYFQTVIYLVFTLLGKFARCEVHSSRGRADCVLETKQFVYLFEFKVDRPAAEALNQIGEKGYADRYAADRRKLFKIGVSFDSEKRAMAEWLVE